MDAKILAKTVLEELIHIAKLDICLEKGTDINLLRLYLNLSLAHANGGRRVIAFLDAEKAFDSVEWGFVWEVLCHFEFRLKFLKWIRMLNCTPRARVRTNDRLST